MIPRFQTTRLFTIGLRSIAWNTWHWAESYEELGRVLGVHVNRPELRAGCSLHEIRGYSRGELRSRPSHTHQDNTLRNARKLWLSGHIGVLFTPDVAEPSSVTARLVPFNKRRVLPWPGLVEVWAGKPNVESDGLTQFLVDSFMMRQEYKMKREKLAFESYSAIYQLCIFAYVP